MTDGYEYGNTRIKAMKARLLTSNDYAKFIESGSLSAMISSLSVSGFKPDLDRALLRYTGVAAILEAMRLHLGRTFRTLKSYYASDALLALQFFLDRWDILNLKTILRGQATHVPAEDILTMIVPAGHLDEAALHELAGRPDLRSTINLLRTWRLPHAVPLLEAWPVYQESRQISVLETALEQFRSRNLHANRKLSALQSLTQALAIEIDSANILMLAEILENKTEVAIEQLRALLLENGNESLPARKLLELSQAGSLEQMIASLKNSRYGDLLNEAFVEYQISGNLSVFQRAFERRLVEQGELLFQRDPLGPGVFIGYIRAKEAEIANLRWIALALNSQLNEIEIRQQLILPFTK